jgi:hypothetical protein
MKRFRQLWMVVALWLVAGMAPLFAQQLKFPPDLERLAAKASEVVDVNMDRRMLDFAGRFMEAEDDAEAKALIKNLRGIYVKSFEFDNPGEYSPADVELFRSQLHEPEWSKVVTARSKRDGENVEVYFHLDNGVSQGLAIIAAGAKELTLIHIDGPIDPMQLSELGGQFGIPAIESGKKPAQKTNTAQKTTPAAVKTTPQAVKK